MQSIIMLALSAFVLSPLLFVAPATANTISSDVGIEKSKEDGGKKERSDIEDLIKGWETPYNSPKALLDAFTASEDGTCKDVMDSKLNLLLDETRYWKVRANGGDGEQKLDKVIEELGTLQLGIAKNRTKLETLSGDSNKCEENENLKFIQEPLEQLKRVMRMMGYYIDNSDTKDFTDEGAETKCEKANEINDKLGDKIGDLRDKIAEGVEVGELDKVANAKQMVTMAEVNFGNAASLITDSADSEGVQKKSMLCGGAIMESNLGLSIFRNANKHYEGDRNDKSSDGDHLGAKIDMFLEIIAEKRVEALAYSGDEKDSILETLDVVRDEILDLQKEFALVKYDKEVDQDINSFDSQLESIKEDLKKVVDAMNEAGDGEELTDAQRKKSSVKLLKKARKQVKKLDKQIENAEDDADTDDEEDVLKYAESALDDAETAKDAGKGYKKTKDYADAQQKAITSLETVRAAKAVLKDGVE